MTKKEIDLAKSAEIICVPKGDDSRPCNEAFSSETGIEVPDFKGRKLRAVSEGRTFYKLKGRDIPYRLAEGIGDIGLTGTDSLISAQFKDKSASNLLYRKIGEPMCRFVLLGGDRGLKNWEEVLSADPRYATRMLSASTSEPELLNSAACGKDLPLKSDGREVNGSVEVYADFNEYGLVADLVQTGNTARDNNLQELTTLASVYPAIAWRENENL